MTKQLNALPAYLADDYRTAQDEVDRTIERHKRELALSLAKRDRAFMSLVNFMPIDFIQTTIDNHAIASKVISDYNECSI